MLFCALFYFPRTGVFVKLFMSTEDSQKIFDIFISQENQVKSIKIKTEYGQEKKIQKKYNNFHIYAMYIGLFRHAKCTKNYVLQQYEC